MTEVKSAVEKLKPEQMEMLQYVLEGKTWVDISELMGLHIQTVYKRKNKEDFQAALKEKRKDCIRLAQAVFSNKAAWAAKRIIEMVDDPDVTRVQFQAATFVYTQGVGITVEEFADRLEELEQSVTREV